MSRRSSSRDRDPNRPTVISLRGNEVYADGLAGVEATLKRKCKQEKVPASERRKKILNPESGKYVKRSGLIGKTLKVKSCQLPEPEQLLNTIANDTTKAVLTPLQYISNAITSVLPTITPVIPSPPTQTSENKEASPPSPPPIADREEIIKKWKLRPLLTENRDLDGIDEIFFVAANQSFAEFLSNWAYESQRKASWLGTYTSGCLFVFQRSENVSDLGLYYRGVPYILMLDPYTGRRKFFDPASQSTLTTFDNTDSELIGVLKWYNTISPKTFQDFESYPAIKPPKESVVLNNAEDYQSVMEKWKKYLRPTMFFDSSIPMTLAVANANNSLDPRFLIFNGPTTADILFNEVNRIASALGSGERKFSVLYTVVGISTGILNLNIHLANGGRALIDSADDNGDELDHGYIITYDDGRTEKYNQLDKFLTLPNVNTLSFEDLIRLKP